MKFAIIVFVCLLMVSAAQISDCNAIGSHRIEEFDSVEAFGRCNDNGIMELLHKAAGHVDPPITITLSSSKQGDCREVQQVELAIEISSDSITGLAVLALSSEGPVGKFVAPQDSSETPLASLQVCQPGYCVEPDDVVICRGMSQSQQIIHLRWTAPCSQWRNITFQYIVSASKEEVRTKERPSNHNNRLKRQMTSVPSIPYLVVASEQYIREITLDGRSLRTIVNGQKKARGLSYNYRANYLYWGDSDSKTIMRSSLDGSNPLIVVDTDVDKPEGLAVDWVTNKLYWVESRNTSIQVLDLSTGARHRLINTGPRSKPRSLVLDPSTEHSWLYWSDWGDPARIQRASMDGQSIETVHNQSTNIRQPWALTIDYDSQILYWADTSLSKILWSQVEPGSPINSFAYHNDRPYGMVVNGGFLFFTYYFGVESRRVDGTENRQQAHFHYCHYYTGTSTDTFYDIDVISEDRQAQRFNPCEVSNGGCGALDLCLLSSVDPRGYLCVQSTETVAITAFGSCRAAGYARCCSSGDCQGQPANCYCDANCVLFKDCCSDAPTDCPKPGEIQPYMVVADNDFNFNDDANIHFMSLDGKRMATPISKLSSRFLGLDYHFSNNHLYLAHKNTVLSSLLDGTRDSPLITSQLPYGLSVDWISDKLYWINSDGLIEILDLKNGFHKELYTTSVGYSGQHSIVVDPINRFLYWTSVDLGYIIYKASMDGSNITELYTTNQLIYNLDLDHSAQVLYWASDEGIWSMGVDGNNPRVVLQLPNGINVFAQWNNLVYWSDDSGFHSIDYKDGSSNTTLVEPPCHFYSRYSGIAIVSGIKQQTGHNPCGTNNGGCSKLCLLSAVDTREYTCVDDDMQTPPTPPPEGSCVDANYTGCCDVGRCMGLPEASYCYCDVECYQYGDCCSDVMQTCQNKQNSMSSVPEGSCVNAGYTGCCDVGQCKGMPPEGSCYCDVDCYQYADCCNDINQICSLTSQCSPKSPTISTQGIVEELTTLTLVCQFSGYSFFTLAWLRQIGQEIQTIDLLITSNRATVNSVKNGSSCPPTISSMLQISAVTQADDGEYICLSTVGETARISVSVPVVNDCLNAPCQNNGKCKDRIAGYECACVEGFLGTNCSERVALGAVKSPNITQPPQSQSHSLGLPVNLTCGADGNPPPLYQWFKDEVEIHGATLPYLYIDVVAPGDRGNYTCTATNEGGTVTSSPGLLNVTEVYQFRVVLDISGDLSRTVEEIIFKTVGTTIEDVTVYSMRILSSMLRTTSLLVTVQSDAASSNVASTLSTWFPNIASSAMVESLQIVRYDGCPEETLPLLISSLLAAGDISASYSWPETEIGAPVLYQPCPNQAGSNSNNTVSRYCGGSYSNGAQWSDVDFSQCSVWAAEILNNATSQPEILQSDAVSETAEVIETVLTDAAIADPMVAEQYLNIIDNIQQVNESVVQESERETGVSMKILNSLGRFQDEVVLSQNVTTPTVYVQESFALHIQDVTTESFDGETFNVDLGSFEEAIRRNTSIPEEALQTSMAVLSNVTASISLPPSLLFDLQGGKEVRGEEKVQRLSYSVFLTDALFQSPNQTARNLSIGTIIVALRLRNISANQTMILPINTTFRISEEVQGAQSSSCVHWEAAAMFGEWSGAGCTEVESKEGERTCQCRPIPTFTDRESQPTYAAHFAVLFDLNLTPPPPGVATALEVITYFGLVVSILSLLLMIITYLCSKKLRNSLHGQIILNICFALLGLYLFFLIAAHVTTVPGLCGLASALLHYFILVFFAWTAAEAVYLYIKLVKVLGVDKYERGYTWKASLLAWLIPGVIVLISLAGYQYYTSRYFCRPTQWPFFFGLILPFVLVYLFNWVMFIFIMASIVRHSQRHAATATGDKSGKLRAVRQKVVIALTLSLVFGLGWGLGLLATSTRVIGITIGFQVIFTLFVGAQGLLLLIFHGFRNDKAREVWKQWLNFVTCRDKKTYSSGASTSNTMKRSTFPSSAKSAPSTSTASYSLGTLTQTDNPSFSGDTLTLPTHLDKSVDDMECSMMGKKTVTDNDYEKPPMYDIPTNYMQQPMMTYTNPAYSTLNHGSLQLESAEQPVMADPTYAVIDIEDCRPREAQDEAPHIYNEVSKDDLGGTRHQCDGENVFAQGSSHCTDTDSGRDMEASVM